MKRIFFKFIIGFSLILSICIFHGISEGGISEEAIRKHVKILAMDLGERNLFHYQNLDRAANYIKEEFKTYGYEPQEQPYTMISTFFKNLSFRNIIATKEGKDKKDKIIIVCAHYDSFRGSPGADDNASAVAVLLELAHLLYKNNFNKTIKFIAFTNEEAAGVFADEDMGSFKYAKEAKSRGEDIEAVLCLESIGFYSDNINSQRLPFILRPFYSNKGNFIGMFSDFASYHLVKRTVKEFKKASNLSIEYLVLPIFFMPVIMTSDNWSFWKFGYKTVLITDTWKYRNPHVHTKNDTYEKLNYQSMGRVVEGLYNVISKLGE